MIELKNGIIFKDQDHVNIFVQVHACIACKHFTNKSSDSVCIPCINNGGKSKFEQSEVKGGNEKC